MMHTDPDVPHRWIIRCGHCDHHLHAVGDRTTAATFARTNGWITTTPTRCPGCATAATHHHAAA